MIRFLCALLCAIAVGCAKGDNPAQSTSSTDPVVRAITADVLPRFRADEQVSLCLDVAVAAAQLSGSAAPTVLFGTVDTTGTATTYLETPSDALILVQPAATTRYQVTRATFDITVSTIREAFLRAHDVACRAARTGAFDLVLSSADNAGATARHAEGSVTDGGDVYDVVLDETGTQATQFDNGAVRYDGRAQRALSVSGDDLDVSSHEDDTTTIVIVDNAAEDRQTTLRIEATVDAADYTLADGVIKRTFVDGIPTERDFWSETHGDVTHAGSVVAALAFDESFSAFRIVLAHSDATTVLESWGL